MKNYKFLIIALLMTLFLCCNKQKDEVRNGYVILEGQFNNSDEMLKIGTWYALDYNTHDTVMIGQYENGLRKGNFKYLVSDSTYLINWKQFRSDSISLNIPAGWEYHSKDGFLFYSLKDSTSGYNVSTVNSDKFNDILEYLDNYMSNIKDNENVERIQSLEFKKEIIQDSILLYSGDFSLKTIEGLEIACITSIFKYNDKIYECNYFRRNGNTVNALDVLIQSNMTTSLFINGKEVMKLPTILEEEPLKFDDNYNRIQ